LLAIYLMMFHTLPSYRGLPGWLQELVSSGYMATSMFFLLSGFILSHVYLSGDGLRITPAEFLKTRFLTLYPIHLIGLALSSAILLVQWRATGTFHVVADIPPAMQSLAEQNVMVEVGPLAMLGSFISHVLLLHAWNPFFLSFNIPSWSISALLCFYLAFVGLGPRLVRCGHPVWLLLGLNVLYLLPPLWFVLQGDYSASATGFLHTNPLARLPEFLSGVVLYRIMRRVELVYLTRGQFWVCLFCAVLALFMLDDWLASLGPAGYYFSHNGGLMLLQCAVLVLFAGVREFRTPWLYEGMKRLGNASLSMFILHLPLFFLLTRFEKLVRFLVAGDWSSPWWPQIKAIEPSVAMYPLIVLVVLAASVWCQESLVIRLRDFLKRRTHSVSSRLKTA
jgi:peptidoglycan/LPS O-acetylase OafA/YrhL